VLVKPVEHALLGELARGLSNRQIAERPVITPKTAGNHVEHIYAKINGFRVQLMYRADRSS
jgi:DNA-binding NarL/FixJ family response regulator